MDRRKQYSKQTKFAALAALERNGGNRYQTAKETGIPHGTLARWVKEAELRGELPMMSRPLPQPDEDAPLDDQLEEVVRRMVAVMPEKVEEASLPELVRSLTAVLATLNQARADKEQSGDVYEKLARLMDRYAPARPADSDLEPPDQN